MAIISTKGGKKGLQFYKKWVNDQKDHIRESVKDVKKKKDNIFDRIKNRGKEPTIFSRLKGSD